MSIDSEDRLFDAVKKLSPRRNSTQAANIKELAAEQLSHFNIEVDGDLGRALLSAVERANECQGSIELMCQETQASMASLETTEQQAEAQIFPITIRFAMGIENPMDLIEHILAASKLSIDQALPDFSSKFMSLDDARKMAKDNYIDMQQCYADAVL